MRSLLCEALLVASGLDFLLVGLGHATAGSKTPMAADSDHISLSRSVPFVPFRKIRLVLAMTSSLPGFFCVPFPAVLIRELV